MIFDTLLITGCGGDIGMALGRIARKAGVARRLIGCDIHSRHPGELIFDAVGVLPRADDARFLEHLSQYLAENQVTALVPSSEAEISQLVLNDAAFLHPATVISANAKAIKIGLDKLETARFLTAHGLAAPWTILVGKEEPLGLPCIIKPRYGRGSKGVLRVAGGDHLRELTKTRAGDILQELLLPDDQEYTCGLYRTMKGECRTIVFRRTLKGGLTGSGEVVDNLAIKGLLVAVANLLDLRGSINVQLRLTADGPKIFEINPRFSSTVMFRHLLGFEDFIWSLQESAGLEVSPHISAPHGTRIFRGDHEYIWKPTH